ncbi:TetR/AcrR family transcriptional regulator [Nocardia cyriacigeorgica]|uniref:TetR/AcrR family transcriptional regulator n=1 Tax=Nocardia cyriacigeorgica TaxID=135487 RepID=UPI002453E43F|nr:TetR family transcriptional regulator [Nocardia cyriacigeorgica]
MRTERGFDHVTLDELCDAVDVSKRTFFRNFAGKEDVAMAPLQDMWRTFLDELEHRPAGDTVLRALQGALLSAVDRTATGDWPRRAAFSYRLSQRTPSMAAHNFQFCDQTSRAAVAALHRQLDLADDPRPRLAVDILVSAFHCAMDSWTVSPDPLDAADLSAELRRAFAAVPGALTLTADVRQAI